MNDNSSTHASHSRIPSDERMDGLLQDFFRLEVPVELNQPFRASPVSGSRAVTLSHVSDDRSIQTRPRSVRFLSLAVAVASMGLVVVMIMSGANLRPANNQQFSNRVPAVPLANPLANPKVRQPMLVSPQGDSQKSVGIVGSDGVTLEETDNIELHPNR